MATELEIRTNQKGLLFDLKKAKKDPNRLDELIVKLETQMEQEDVAYVNEKFNEVNS